MRNYKPSRFGATPPDWYVWLIYAGIAVALLSWLWEWLFG